MYSRFGYFAWYSFCGYLNFLIIFSLIFVSFSNLILDTSSKSAGFDSLSGPSFFSNASSKTSLRQVELTNKVKLATNQTSATSNDATNPFSKLFSTFQSIEAHAQTPTNPSSEGSAIHSPSLTIYHDTDNPDDPIISSISSPSYNPIVDFSQAQRVECSFVNFSLVSNCPITKDTQFSLNLTAERQSDIEYKLTRKVNNNPNPEQIILNPNPNNIIDEHTRLERNGKDGQTEAGFWLGANIKPDNKLWSENTTRDEENPNCLGVSNSPIINRRIGICNDGIYSLQTRSTDTAGNSSNWVERSLERDSTAPNQPVVEAGKSGDILAEFLSLKVEGEGGARVEINIASNYGYNQTFNFNLDQGGVFKSDKFVALECGQKVYTITTKLIDRAGNVSQATIATITSDECFRCTTNGKGILGLPVPDEIRQSITGEFPRYKVTYGGVHAGMDFASTAGTPIIASADGIVTKVTMGYPDYGQGEIDPAGWANMVIIEHAIPNQPKMQTIYAHLQNIPTVSSGQNVKKGQVIGYMGSSGASTGPHLHFQVEVEGSILNPLHAGRFNRWPPQNPRNYLGDIDGNGTPEMQANYCDFESKGNGDLDNPWGDYQDAAEIGEFKLILQKDKNNSISKVLQPSPKITFIDSSTKQGQAVVYGLGIYKNSPMLVEAKEEKCKTYFLWICTAWEYQTVYQSSQGDEKIQHAEIKLYKEGSDTELGQLWNDDPPFEKGKWKYNSIQLGNEINYGDKICVKSKVHGKINQHPDKWWNELDYGGVEVDGECEQIISASKYSILDTVDSGSQYVEYISNLSFGNTLFLIKRLEEYYSEKNIIGLLFRGIYEPEWYWDYAAIGSDKYKDIDVREDCSGNGVFCVFNDPLPPCDLKICSREEKYKIEDILRNLRVVSGCNYNSGCDGDTARLLWVGIDKDPVNIGHVFAGWSIQYFQDRSVPNVSTNNIRTYTGDMSGSINTCYIKGSCSEIDNENNSKFIDKWLWEGNFEKADIPADIDSYVIRKLQQDKGLKVSESLEEYYGLSNTQNVYYQNRYEYVKNNSLGKDYNSSEDLKHEIFQFAYYLNGNIFGLNYKNTHKELVTNRVYETFECLDKDKSTGGSSIFWSMWERGNQFNLNDLKNINQGRNLYFQEQCLN